MVDTKPPFCLFVSSTAWRRHGHRMKPPRWKIEIAASGDESKLWALGQKKSLPHSVGWKSEMFRPQERCFFLTSPFMELIRSWRGLKESSRTSKWEFAFATSLALREGQNY